MDAPRIMVVDDDANITEVLSRYLEREGFAVETSSDGADALQRVLVDPPDLMVLDLMLPGVDGLEICRRLRAVSPVPVIMLTARGTEADLVIGLELGADDYVAKPFRIRELVARMRAVLRRAPGPDQPTVDADIDVLEVGDVALDSSRHEVVIRGEAVVLPLKEFDLLELLLENAGRVLTRDVLIDRVWGHDYVGDTKTLDVHVKRLRAKVENDPSTPTRIVTIRGLGYKYEVPRSRHT